MPTTLRGELFVMWNEYALRRENWDVNADMSTDSFVWWPRLATTISGSTLAIFQTNGPRGHWGGLPNIHRSVLTMIETVTPAELSIWIYPTPACGFILPKGHPHDQGREYFDNNPIPKVLRVDASTPRNSVQRRRLRDARFLLDQDGQKEPVQVTQFDMDAVRYCQEQRDHRDRSFVKSTTIASSVDSPA